MAVVLRLCFSLSLPPGEYVFLSRTPGDREVEEQSLAGVIEDANNRGRLAKLLRVHTSAAPDTLSSLEEYVARMKDGQKSIFYICGSSMDEVQKSPFLEQLLAQGYEVILFTEPMDEYMMQVRPPLSARRTPSPQRTAPAALSLTYVRRLFPAHMHAIFCAPDGQPAVWCCRSEGKRSAGARCQQACHYREAGAELDRVR